VLKTGNREYEIIFVVMVTAEFFNVRQMMCITHRRMVGVARVTVNLISFEARLIVSFRFNACPTSTLKVIQYE